MPAWLSDLMNVTTCQRCPTGSWLGGIPFSGEPWPINQKSSPSFADCAGPWARAGTLPEPIAFLPWQEAQLTEKRVAPFLIVAASVGLKGFFRREAKAGAWRKREATSAETAILPDMSSSTSKKPAYFKKTAYFSVFMDCLFFFIS